MGRILPIITVTLAVGALMAGAVAAGFLPAASSSVPPHASVPKSTMTPTFVPEPEAAPMPTWPTPSGDARKTGKLDDVRNMRWLREHMPEAYEKVRNYSWTRNGVADQEVDLLEAVTDLLARNGGQDAMPVLNMPFLDSPNNGDQEALMALGQILGEDEEAFQEIVRRLPPKTARPVP